MLANMPADKVRIHLCWGNYEGPHDHDVGVEKLLPIIRKIKAKAISYEAANPRHEHEWIHWRDAKLPDDIILIPGVIDSSTNYVEHPELVAQRLERLAKAVGKDRVWAGTDCGFGTFAGYSKVDPGIAWKKFRSDGRRCRDRVETVVELTRRRRRSNHSTCVKLRKYTCSSIRRRSPTFAVAPALEQRAC